MPWKRFRMQASTWMCSYFFFSSIPLNFWTFCPSTDTLTTTALPLVTKSTTPSSPTVVGTPLSIRPSGGSLKLLPWRTWKPERNWLATTWLTWRRRMDTRICNGTPTFGKHSLQSRKSSRDSQYHNTAWLNIPHIYFYLSLNKSNKLGEKLKSSIVELLDEGDETMCKVTWPHRTL